MDHRVHKYTGLARKWNREVLTAVRVDPLKEVLQNFLGVSYLLRGSSPLSPVKYSPGCCCCSYHTHHLPCDIRQSRSRLT